MTGTPIDLGDGYSLVWTRWDPDLEINPRYRLYASQLPVERWGALVTHPRPDGAGGCQAGIVFDGPVQREVDKRTDFWTLDEDDPVTIGGSVACRECGAHFVIAHGQARPV